MTKYIFDVSDLRVFLQDKDNLSGIQRVVVMTIVRAQYRLGKEKIWLGYLDKINKRYVLVQPTPDLDLSCIDHMRALLGINVHVRALPGMEDYRKHKIRCLIRMWAMDLGAALSYRPPFRRHEISPERWKRLRTPRRALGLKTIHCQPIETVAQPGDHIVLLDNVQKQTALEPHLRAAHARGIEITALLHDLIPVVMPQVAQGDMPRRMHDWLVRSTSYVSRYVANSQNTAQDLSRFLATHGAEQPLYVVPLAQAPLEISSPVTEGDGVDAALYPDLAKAMSVPDRIRRLAKREFVLVVGTMEIRKNLWGIAQAWDKLRADSELVLPKLVFAGRQGWLNDDFDSLIQGTGNLGGWVEVIKEPSDSDLVWLYRQCLFTVMASFYEGWGLPIGESLAYGKTAVVSRTSAMPEVGGDMVEYCDPHDISSIAAACRRLVANPQHRLSLEARISLAKLRSWEDVASELVDTIQMAGKVGHSDSLSSAHLDCNKTKP